MNAFDTVETRDGERKTFDTQAEAEAFLASANGGSPEGVLQDNPSEQPEAEQPAALSLDQLAESTLMRVSAFIGECAGGDTFCGFSVDEVRDENGLLLSLQLVPCDSVNGEPVRRVGR